MSRTTPRVLKNPAAPAAPAVTAAVGDHDHEDEGGEVLEEEVPFDVRNVRLDAWLAETFDAFSRSRLAKLIDDGAVTVDDAQVKSNFKLKGGERVRLVVPPPVATTLEPEDIPLEVIYDDDDVCVINKPAGVVVHPGAGHDRGTIANGLLFRFPNLLVGGERRPGIVHRLDKDTSGLLVVAKHDEALRHLASQFENREVEKRYVAVCFGRPGYQGHKGEYLTGHRRAERDRRRFTTTIKAPDADATSIRGGVRTAHTRYCVRHCAGGMAVMDIELLTGRTHQIRAHFADAGHVLASDDLYGGANIDKRLQSGPVRDAVATLRRQALHAAVLGFTHPRTGERLRFECPIPADLVPLVEAVAALEATLEGSLEGAPNTAFDPLQRGRDH